MACVESLVLMFEHAIAFIYVYTVDGYNVVIQNCICTLIHFTDDDCDDSYYILYQKLQLVETHHLEITMYIPTDVYPCVVNI